MEFLDDNNVQGLLGIDTKPSTKWAVNVWESRANFRSHIVDTSMANYREVAKLETSSPEELKFLVCKISYSGST
jgi:hypothetical protein